ncbi:MAG TPA: TonB-dependent receptor plug domain-containing protein, partial [Anaeromyxobacteraceae bacterium]|nr:TonB-dependent receptor plug domain-containing protein [Anaeromyxobacteraceae bacterium]
MRSTRARGVLLALLATWGPVARGEGEPPPVVLEEQVIHLPREAAPQDPTASATVVEAGRYAGELKGVAELAATAPGVAIRSYGGLGQLSTISIRGSTAAGVRVLLDGIPLDTA